MGVQLLDKTRKINKLLHNNSSSKVVFNDICEVLTEILNDPRQVKALEDVSLCIAHFCMESNTMYNNTDIPQIVSLSPGTLPLVYESENDPLSGINF